MAQSGYTPLSLYYSATASTAPLAANLVAGELALNTNDGKLYYKDSGGVVQVLATKAGSSGSFGALTATSITDSGLTSGRVTYATTGGLLTDSANMTFNGTTGFSVNGITQIYNTNLYNVDGTISNYSANNAVYINGNTAGALTLQADGTQTTRITLYGATSSLPNVTQFFTSTAERMRIDSSGRLLVGTTSASGANLLQVSSDASISGLTVGKGGGAVATSTTVGYQGLNAQTAGPNDAFGYQSMLVNTSGSYNVAYGYYTLKANTTGSVNSAFGNQALAANTTGSSNSAVGVGSLLSNTTGGSNTAMGDSALRLNTTASNNTAVGYQAGYSNTTGANLVALGRLAGYSNTTANDNTFVGIQAGYTNSTGSSLAFFGANAGYANTIGASNTAIGVGSLQANTTASNNTAVGYQAGYANTTGAKVAHFGYRAGYNSTGDYNTYIGAESGFTTTTGAYNTGVGYGSISSDAGGSYNTAIGYLAGGSLTTGSKNTIIGCFNGNQNGLNIAASSNYIVLSDGDGNPRLVGDNNGHWGIGNTSPSYPLSIKTATETLCVYVQNTNASANGDMVQVAVSLNTTNGTTRPYAYYNAGAGAYRFWVLDSGNVQNTNNSYGAFSDAKLKENIVDASPKLEDLCKVKVRQYNLKTDQTHKQIGVVAQELEEVFAGLVEEIADRDSEGNDLGTTTKTVKYSVFVPMLIKAVQELKAEVDSLKQQLGK